MNHFTLFTRAHLLALLSLWGAGACAQTYPNHPIQVIAPSTAGGGFDLVGRVLGGKLSEQLGQQFVVENKPGNGTLLGTQTIAKAPADGYHPWWAVCPTWRSTQGFTNNPATTRSMTSFPFVWW
jgi:tripartite-type tricarboxylate transporter receptor subunit TctC